MARKSEIDDLIRRALNSEDGVELPGEPGLPDIVTEVFRGKMWWVGAYMFALITAGSILAVVCAAKFLNTRDVPEMLRWGAGFFVSVIVTLGCKMWYWMQLERLATTREIKRLELLLAQLTRQSRRQE